MWETFGSGFLELPLIGEDILGSGLKVVNKDTQTFMA